MAAGESVNSVWLLTAALCTYAIGYRFYSKWIAARVLALNDRRATPCEAHEDGKDFVRTNKWIVFGHHFAAISGPGPLVGPVLAAQFGYLPGTIWILIGVVLGGAVQDFVILFCSMRRDGKSLGQMVKEELNSTVGYLALLLDPRHCMIILAGGPGISGGPGPGRESVGGVHRRVLDSHRHVHGRLPAVLAGGKGARGLGHRSRAAFAGGLGGRVRAKPRTPGPLVQTRRPGPGVEPDRLYGFAASILPVWLLLAPRDYLSTFMKLGTIFLARARHFPGACPN